MDDPMRANLLRDLKSRLAQKASEAPRNPLNIGFGLGSPSSVATDSSSSPLPQFMTPGDGSPGSADSWDSLMRPSSGPASPPPPHFSFANPLYAGDPINPSCHEIQEESPLADFRTAEVHHREPLTRPLSPPRRVWGAQEGPLDVDPISVTVIDPDGSFVYRRAGAPKRTFLARLMGAARNLWPASALAQAPVWFEQWWNKGKGRRPARPRTQSTWSLLRTGELDSLDLDSQALLQIAAFILLAILVVLLIYLVYDSWAQGRQGIRVAAAGNGKPNGRVIYMTRSQFKRERARRKGKVQPAKPSTAAAPSAVVKTPPPDSTTTLYEYPPRRVL